MIFFGAALDDPPGLSAPSVYQSLAAETGGLVARGEGTDGTLYEAPRKADPWPAKTGLPNVPAETAGGDIASDELAAAGGLAAVAGAGGDAADMGPPSVLNSDHRGHFLFVFICPI